MTPSSALVDQHGRTKRKLRLSLTDRCQFRCQYCMPETPTWLPRESILRREELTRLATIAVTQLGVTHIRLTGGEPLLRKDVVEITAAIAQLKTQGLKKLSMTSNGARLHEFSLPLKAAGLDDVNISLDAVDAKLFQQLTKSPLQPVLNGIAAAKAADIPVKINAVLMKGQNEQQILPMLDWAARENLELRFIEFMPLDSGHRWDESKVVTETDILNIVGQTQTVSVLPKGHEPATRYQLNGGQTFGIIPTISHAFCGSCDRIRITAKGEIFACLFSQTGTDLLSLLRNGSDDETLAKAISGDVWKKHRGYIDHPGYVERPTTMHAMGG